VLIKKNNFEPASLNLNILFIFASLIKLVLGIPEKDKDYEKRNSSEKLQAGCL
jgi:hypothetical protein